MPLTCSKSFAPSPPPLPDADAEVFYAAADDQVCSQLTQEYVTAEECTPCQANAFCASCGSDNAYCNAFLKAHGDVFVSPTNIGVADSFFVNSETQYWCADAVQSAIADGSYDPAVNYDVPDGAKLVFVAERPGDQPRLKNGIIY